MNTVNDAAIGMPGCRKAGHGRAPVGAGGDNHSSSRLLIMTPNHAFEPTAASVLLAGSLGALRLGAGSTRTLRSASGFGPNDRFPPALTSALGRTESVDDHAEYGQNRKLRGVP